MEGTDTILAILQRRVSKAEKIMDEIRDDHEANHVDEITGDVDLKACVSVVCNLVGQYDQAVKEGR